MFGHQLPSFVCESMARQITRYHLIYIGKFDSSTSFWTYIFYVTHFQTLCPTISNIFSTKRRANNNSPSEILRYEILFEMGSLFEVKMI